MVWYAYGAVIWIIRSLILIFLVVAVLKQLSVNSHVSWRLIVLVWSSGLGKNGELVRKSSGNRSPKSIVEPAKYVEKPAKWGNQKVAPQNIHQPRWSGDCVN